MNRNVKVALFFFFLLLFIAGIPHAQAQGSVSVGGGTLAYTETITSGQLTCGELDSPHYDYVSWTNTSFSNFSFTINGATTPLYGGTDVTFVNGIASDCTSEPPPGGASTATLTYANGSNGANWSIKAPAATDNHSGPLVFNPWHDNIYGSFAFFNPSRPVIPPASIGSSSSSLSFSYQQFGTTSSLQVITVTNNSTVPMVMSATSFNPTGFPAATFSTQSFSLVNDNCSGTTLQAGGSCTLAVQFSPVAADLQATGTTAINGTMILQGVELAPGSTNVLITTQVPLSATGSY